MMRPRLLSSVNRLSHFKDPAFLRRHEHVIQHVFNDFESIQQVILGKFAGMAPFVPNPFYGKHSGREFRFLRLKILNSLMEIKTHSPVPVRIDLETCDSDVSKQQFHRSSHPIRTGTQITPKESERQFEFFRNRARAPTGNQNNWWRWMEENRDKIGFPLGSALAVIFLLLGARAAGNYWFFAPGLVADK
jgi:hypothetical protein